MEIRLNKLISEAGVCSRREADNFIEMERVTVNGKQPHVGQKVTAEDVVLVDGERLNVEKYIRLQEEEKKEVQQEKELLGTLRKAKPENKGGREGAKMEKFGKFNKYAAARKAQKEGGWKSKTAKLTDEEKLLRDALRPKFGKALSKSAVAQRIAANPKSAALRKTSKNNPINKAKRAAHRKNRNHEGDDWRTAVRQERIRTEARLIAVTQTGLPSYLPNLGRGVPEAGGTPPARPWTRVDQYRGGEIPKLS